MHSKEKMVHFLEQSSEKLRLSYQSTLQSIQVINVLDTLHGHAINRMINKNIIMSKCFAISILALCCKLYETNTIHMRDYVKLIDPRYKNIGIQALQKNSMSSQQKLQSSISSRDIQYLIKEYQIKIMMQLGWKLSMPLLYDQVIIIAFNWDNYTNDISEFPIKFESNLKNENDLNNGNHNSLVKYIRICLSNFTHLIKNTNIEIISDKIRKISLALFFVSIKFIIKNQIRQHPFVLSSKISISFLLSDFFKKFYNVLVQDISAQIHLVTEVLQNYRLFHDKSKQNKEKKKNTHKSKKQSQDKENIMYYVNRQINRSKQKKSAINTDQRTQKYKSRSHSRKECQKNIKGKSKITKSKNTIILKPNKKSSSTKSIISKYTVIGKEKDKGKDKNHVQGKKQPKTVKFSKSRMSKRSEKSQLNSKILVNSNLQNQFCSKSTYWLKSATLMKTDKKSTNSSIRMKIR